MSRLMSLANLGIGAALMYWLDPEHGRRRRVEVKHQAIRLGNEGMRALDIATRDLENRIRGFFAENRARFSRETASDETIAQRARAKLGRVCSHPSLIETSCRDGRLLVKGPVLEYERDRVLRAMSRVPGVRVVENALEPFVETSPEARGLTPPAGTRRRGFTPAGRLVMGCAGVLMCLYGIKQRGLIGGIFTTAGIGMTLRGVTNMKIRQLVGLGRARHPIAFTKTFDVHASPDEVFGWFSAPEHFPRFMSNVKEVTKRPNGQYRWKVTGPIGTNVEWNASITRHEPEQHTLAWSSEPGSTISHSGVVQCEPNRDGTRVTIRMSYAPPFGMLGHGFAKLFGVDPKTLMDNDLVRFKSLLEQGKATARGHTVRREEIEFAPPQPQAQPNAEEQLQLH